MITLLEYFVMLPLEPLVGMQVMGLLFGLVKISFLQAQRSHMQKKPMQGLFSQLCILPEDRDFR